jgi:hypothetical protein
MVYISHWSRFELTTLVVIGTDSLGSCKSNYHTLCFVNIQHMYIVLKKTGRKAGLWWMQIICISTANVRILCLSFNANKTTLWVRISINARCTPLCNKICQWLATARWFSPGTPVSSIKKNDCIMYYYRFLLFAIYMNQVPEKLHVLDPWPHNTEFCFIPSTQNHFIITKCFHDHAELTEGEY